MIAGNYHDKYQTQNPIEQLLMKSFLSSLHYLMDQIPTPKKIVELGAGEGVITKIVSQKFPKAKIIGSDISKGIIAVAKKQNKAKNITYQVADAQKTPFKKKQFDLSFAIETLEHVPEPKKALSEIKRITQGYAILSVPREPIWRILNLFRLKYIKDLGNTPGHLNHWSSDQFVSFVKKSGLKPIKVLKPFPWTMVLARI